MTDETKQCKYCQEEIKAKAKRCPKCQGDLRGWPARHPILTGLLGLVALIVFIAVVGESSPSSNTDRVSNTETTQEGEAAGVQTTSETQEKSQPTREKMTIANSTVKDKGFGIVEVVGEITNNDSTKHSATIKATFYDTEGKILGTAVGAINDVVPGQTKTFNLMSTDEISGYEEYKVEVDTLL